MFYLWIKALHIIFVVMWFAGLLYLPRLFVYHAQSVDMISRERFVVMERKLFVIMSIGALLAFGFGLWMLTLAPALAQQAWMHAKLTLVLALVIYHFYCLKLWRQFRAQKNRHSHVFYRWFNELPALLLIVVTILVVVKPF